MGFQKVSGKNIFYKLDEKKPGDVLVESGKYAGTMVSEKYGNTQHKFRMPDDSVVILGGGHLNFVLDQCDIKKGEVCRVIYNGKQKLTAGKFAGRDSHQFEVFVDRPDDADQEASQEEDVGVNDSDITL